MALYERKQKVVEAREYTADVDGIVVSAVKGEQRVKKGDYLVGNQPGKVVVMTKDEFFAEYEPSDIVIAIP